MLTLKSSTQILIIAQGTSDGKRKRVTLPITLNLPIGAFVWFISFSLALFETFDQTAGAALRFGGELYRLLFVGWADDWPIIWLAIRQIAGCAYVS